MATTKTSTPTVSKSTATASIANSKLSPSMKAAATAGLSSYYPDTPSPTKTTTTDPVTSSTVARANIKALDTDISGLKSAYDTENLSLKEYQDRLNARRETEIAGLKTEFDIAKGKQEEGQKSDYASRATSLVTSGGGFLGATQSQQGVLQNLQTTHDAESTALMAKREAAINTAKQAYEDKDFALAKEMANNAKDYQKELYNRKKDYAESVLSITREKRAQTEFDLGLAEKKSQAYALMSDSDFANVNPKDIALADSVYYPGYTEAKRKIDIAANTLKTSKDQAALDAQIIGALAKIPQGQKVTIAGKTYVGLKKASGSGSTKGLITSSIANQLGVPTLAGKDESDVILSLSLENPPQWYKDYYKATNPSGYTAVLNNPNALKADWLAFTNLPDIQAYKNSSVVTKRIDAENSKINVSAEDIAAALNEEE